VTGFALYASGLLGVALAGGPPLLVGSLLAFGAGSRLVTPTLFAGLSALAPDGVRAGRTRVRLVCPARPCPSE
jgi:hypothetical protein